MASGLLKRNISAATGVSVSTAPAIRPAAAPCQRLTAAYSTPTEATPMRAWGTRIDHEFTPKIRAASTLGHSDRGGLSTVMRLAASELPKNIAFQLWVPAWTAAE